MIIPSGSITLQPTESISWDGVMPGILGGLFALYVNVIDSPLHKLSSGFTKSDIGSG